jgi:hypothetical protein
MKVEIYQLPTLPTFLRTSSPTNGGPLTPSGSFYSSLQPCNKEPTQGQVIVLVAMHEQLDQK